LVAFPGEGFLAHLVCCRGGEAAFADGRG
jgi:hypothetical protein